MKQFKLSKKEINYALFGLVLGDATYKNGIIQVERQNAEKYYIEWLAKFSRQLRLSFQVILTDGSDEYSSIQIRVPSRRHFENNRMVTSHQQKVASKYVLRRITPLGLFLWFMNAGIIHVSLKKQSVKRYGYLKTQIFNKNEHIQIQKMFRERFQIETKLHTFQDEQGKDRYQIHFNATNLRKLIDIIRNYIPLGPPELRGKFSLQYMPVDEDDELAKKYNFE